MKITSRRRHEVWLENYSFDDAQNLTAHFETLNWRTNISSSVDSNDESCATLLLD